MPNDHFVAPEAALHALGYELRVALSNGSAPPFLGLALNQDRLVKARRSFQAYGPSGFRMLLQKHGSVVAWAICAALAEEYGDGNNEVWPILARLLGVREIAQPQRDAIYETFGRICRKAGLPFGGLARSVDAYLLHAGPARSQLPALAAAFLVHERSAGSAPDDDTVALNRWEDDSLIHLHPSLTVLPRCIIMDASAYMATAFLRWRQGDRIATGYLAEFQRELDAADRKGCNVGGVVHPARPRLIWSEGRPHLDVPDLNGDGSRIRVQLDGDLLRLRPGPWPLPLPPARSVSWDENGTSRDVSLYPRDHGPSSLVLFDPDTGRRVLLEGTGCKMNAAIATPVLTSTIPFEVNGDVAPMLGPDFYGMEVDLRRGEAEITLGDARLRLKGAQRTRIALRGSPIARGSAPLWGPEAVVEVDPGQYVDTEDALSLCLELEQDRSVQNGVVLLGRASEPLEKLAVGDLLSRAGLPNSGSPARLRLTLMRTGTDGPIPTRFHRVIDIWPGFVGCRDRLIESISPPENFRIDESTHVECDDSGHLCFEEGLGFTEARVTFDMGGGLRTYIMRPSGTTAVLEQADGSSKPWTLGDTILVGARASGGALVVRSQLKEADLRVGKRIISKPFANGGTWAIPLATVRGDGPIALLPPTGVPTSIAEVELASEPAKFDARTWAGEAELCLSMRERMSALRVVRLAESGPEDVAEVRFDHRPHAAPPAPWVRVCRSLDKSAIVRVRADGPGVSRFEFSAEISGHVGEQKWARLSNGRGDRYAVMVRQSADWEGRPSVLRRVDSWMSECYAAPSWNEGGVGALLTSRWQDLLRYVADAPGGMSFLLSLAHGDEEDAGWLPMRHIVEIVPSLHSARPSAFATLSNARTPAGRAMHRLASLTGDGLRDAQWIDPIALMAFSNVAKARSGARLTGFSGKRLRDHLHAEPDQLRRAGRRWDGGMVLGKDHAGAALRRLNERLEDHALLEHSIEDGPMSERSLALNQICRSVREQGRPLALSASDAEGSVTMIDRLLAAYAHCARRSKLDEFRKWIGGDRGLRSLGEAIRLAPELLAFHLLVAELEATR